MNVKVSHMRTSIEGLKCITKGAKQAFSEIADDVLEKHGGKANESTCAKAYILFELLAYRDVICLAREVPVADSVADSDAVPAILRDIDTIKTTRRDDLKKISGSVQDRFEAINGLQIPDKQKPLCKIIHLSWIYQHPGNVQKYVPESKEAALEAIDKLAIEEKSKNILKERVEESGHADPLLSQFIFFNDGYQKMLDCITSFRKALKNEAVGILAKSQGLSEEYVKHVAGNRDNYTTWTDKDYPHYQRLVGSVFYSIYYD